MISKALVISYTAFKDQNIEELAKLLNQGVVDPINKTCCCCFFHQNNYCSHLQGCLLAYGKVEKPKILVKKPRKGRKRSAKDDQEGNKKDETDPELQKTKKS